MCKWLLCGFSASITTSAHSHNKLPLRSLLVLFSIVEGLVIHHFKNYSRVSRKYILSSNIHIKSPLEIFKNTKKRECILNEESSLFLSIHLGFKVKIQFLSSSLISWCCTKICSQPSVADGKFIKKFNKLQHAHAFTKRELKFKITYSYLKFFIYHLFRYK
jgi:hypothetical protein